jgi:hypothetical protein
MNRSLALACIISTVPAICGDLLMLVVVNPLRAGMHVQQWSMTILSWGTSAGQGLLAPMDLPSEVEDLDAPVFGDEEVLRLEIAVNDGLVVRGGESMSDLHRVIDGFANRN